MKLVFTMNDNNHNNKKWNNYGIKNKSTSFFKSRNLVGYLFVWLYISFWSKDLYAFFDCRRTISISLWKRKGPFEMMCHQFPLLLPICRQLIYVYSFRAIRAGFWYTHKHSRCSSAKYDNMQHVISKFCNRITTSTERR